MDKQETAAVAFPPEIQAEMARCDRNISEYIGYRNGIASGWLMAKGIRANIDMDSRTYTEILPEG